jgi:hypothetical protein
MDLGRIRDRAHVLSLGASHAFGQIELRNRCRSVANKGLLEGGIDPGAGHDLGTIKRTHLGLEKRQDVVDGLAGDDPFLDQKRLERPRASGVASFPIGRICESLRHLLRLCGFNQSATTDGRSDRGGRAGEKKIASAEAKVRVVRARGFRCGILWVSAHRLDLSLIKPAGRVSGWETVDPTRPRNQFDLSR